MRTLLLGVAFLELVSLFPKIEGWSWVTFVLFLFKSHPLKGALS